MDVLLETPPPALETSHIFFRLFILQALRLSVMDKSIKVNLGQSQELIMCIHTYLST